VKLLCEGNFAEVQPNCPLYTVISKAEEEAQQEFEEF
jgi:hypothetical protein